MVASLEKILTTASSGLSAQSVRMNTISSNLANAGSVGSTPEATYHTKYPIFSEVTRKIPGLSDPDQPLGGVQVTGVKSSTKPLDTRYDPNNPQANKEGYVYVTDVNQIEQMTNMISASKDYEANVQIMNTTKDLLNQSLNLLK